MKQSFIAKTIFLLLCSCPQIGLTQEDPDASSLGERNSYRNQIEEMETRLGRYDLRLVEPLSRLAETTIPLNRFDDIHSILDRAVQIQRVNEGLYTESQLPLLRMMLENNMRRGEWEDANEDFDHLLWLYTNKHKDLDTDLVYELMGLSELHLEAMAGDTSTSQADHLLRAAEINVYAIRVAEAIWGAVDPRLLELYYSLVKQYHLQTITMERGRQASYKLREVAPGSGLVRSRQTQRQVQYQSGNALLLRMREIFTKSQPVDLEAAAMVDLYLADWELLYTRPDSAMSYAKAFDGLSQSGVDIGALNSFLSRPALLPVNQFHFSLADAMSARNPAIGAENIAAEPAGSSNQLQFFEWSPALPNVQFPMARTPLLFIDQQGWHVARLAFELDALEKVTRWVNGRWATNISVPQQPQVLSENSELTLPRDELDYRLHNLHFRPRIQDGQAQPSRVTLQYHYFPQ